MNKEKLNSPARPNVRAGETLDDDSTGAQAAAQPESRAEPARIKYMPKESAILRTKQGKSVDGLSESDQEDVTPRLSHSGDSYGIHMACM